jgi:hypothetical protein
MEKIYIKEKRSIAIWDVNPIRWCCWNSDTDEWEIDYMYMKSEVFTFIVVLFLACSVVIQALM